MSPSHTRGESILEVLVAISLLTVLIPVVSALLLQSRSSTEMNRRDLIATTLANDGVEQLMALRDSNLLRFAVKKEECWNTKPNHAELETCADNRLVSGEYRLTVDPVTRQWDFEPLANAPALSGDLSLPTDDQYQLLLDPTLGLYSHNLGPQMQETPLFRHIHLAVLDLDNDNNADQLKVTVRVRTKVGTKLLKVDRTAFIYPTAL